MRLTLLLVAANVIVFFLQLSFPQYFDQFAFTPALALEQPWTFITSMFMHGDFTHLFFNMFVLLMFGIALEGRVGVTRFLFIYFLAGIIGSLGYMVTATDSFRPAVGASGAIYGVLGTLAILMPATMIWVGGFFPMPMAVAVLFWALSDFFGLFAPSGIAHGAHLGGLFVGLIYGFIMRRRENRRRVRERRVKLDGYASWEV